MIKHIINLLLKQKVYITSLTSSLDFRLTAFSYF